MMRPRTTGLLVAALAGLVVGLLSQLLQLSGIALLICWALAIVVLVPLTVFRVQAAISARRHLSSKSTTFVPVSFSRTRIWHEKRLIWQRNEYLANYAAEREFKWQDSTYERSPDPVGALEPQPAWAVSLPEEKIPAAEFRP